MTFSGNFVVKKIEEIEDYLKEIRELFEFDDKKIIGDTGNLHIAERLLQLVVDTMLDINQHFIKELKLKTADDFQSTFYILAENNVLPKNFAKKIAPVVGLRNRIVHRYDTIDKALFIKTFRKNISDFEKYQKFIVKYLKNN